MDSTLYDNRILVHWREEADLTQDEVAKQLNVSRATINRIEAGTNASIEMLHDLADLYRKPILDVLRQNKLAPAG